ncbi:alcohol dehydrogenase catalytic domain-containing protein [Bacteroides cellulosilyticus]|uniref:alcohol dehydrogenase catalytic domain-containing protein n=1 Tax=Bacteroides cellulosilyticus TaxID=246787 RepID=UPI0022E7F1F1|nr:alcohol dehydrogenase catalytic domain-containing protein [Bacteroides cellulosilyticus]
MKNKIIRLNAPHCLEILEKDISINLDEDEVLVEIDRISLCGSDLKLYNGCYNAPSLYPIVIGHEWAGKTIITGNKVTKVKVGDKVTGDCSIYCGKCPECNIDKNICRNIEKYGITRNGFGQKYKIVPERYLYKSSHILENKYLALTECFSVALHAIKKMKLIANAQNDEILIIGGGSIGVAIYLLLTYVYKLNNVFILESSTAKVSFFSKKEQGVIFLNYNDMSDKRRISGIEIFMKYIKDNLELYGSYSYLHSRSYWHDVTYKSYNNMDYNIKLMAAYNYLGIGKLSMSYSLHPGSLYTPICGAEYNDNISAYQPTYSSKWNTKRLSRYNRLDLNIEVPLFIQKKNVLFFFSVTNILNLHNERDIIYNSSYSQSSKSYYDGRIIYFGVNFSL